MSRKVIPMRFMWNVESWSTTTQSAFRVRQGLTLIEAVVAVALVSVVLVVILCGRNEGASSTSAGGWFAESGSTWDFSTSSFITTRLSGVTRGVTRTITPTLS